MTFFDVLNITYTKYFLKCFDLVLQKHDSDKWKNAIILQSYLMTCQYWGVKLKWFFWKYTLTFAKQIFILQQNAKLRKNCKVRRRHLLSCKKRIYLTFIFLGISIPIPKYGIWWYLSTCIVIRTIIFKSWYYHISSTPIKINKLIY